MKKDFDEEKAKIIVTIIPFVLIIIVLLVTLIVSSVKGGRKDGNNQDLQDSIKEYADTNLTDSERTDSSSVVTDTQEETPDPDEREELSGQEAASASPEATPTPYQERLPTYRRIKRMLAKTVNRLKLGSTAGRWAR